jgi:hypothetical protein
VDLIVEPSIFLWGDPSRAVEQWGSTTRLNLGCMMVTVDMSL